MTVTIIYTGKDAFNYEANPTTNYGSNEALWCRNQSGHENRTFIGFNITSAPIASHAKLVYLWLYGYHNGMSGFSANFNRITSGWSEGGVTWNTQPNVTSTNQYQHNLPTSQEWVQYDVTNLYKDAKNAGNELGIRISRPGSGGQLNSVCAHEQGNAPYITIGHENHYYVKTDGSDALDGTSWATAWATIDKAATTVEDCSSVHIGFGNYFSEPISNKIAPQNVGIFGIKYVCETSGGSGGIGSVKVKKVYV